MYTFLHKKKINFLSNSCFSARNHEHLDNKTGEFFFINQVCTFCVFFYAMTFFKCKQLTDLVLLVLCYNLTT